MAPKSKRYLIPARVHRVEEVILRSRFITVGTHTRNPEEAQRIVSEIRDEYPDATHHCWAFVAGPPGSTLSIGMSDDGEPHGTAGRPMLNALLHSDVGEIVAVCIRYYGGTKLGTGGLSRAYSGGVKLLLESLPTVERVERVRHQVIIDYASADAARRLFEELEAIVEVEEYGEKVEYVLALPEEHVTDLTRGIAGITKGQGVIKPA